MKKTILGMAFALVLALALCICPARADAAVGDVIDMGGPTYYEITSEGDSYEVMYKGGMPVTGDFIIPNHIWYGVKMYKVTSIAANAFEGNTLMTSVTISDNVSSIGSGAFSGCTGLVSVTLGSGIKEISAGMFFRCSKLASVEIKSGIEKIGESAFFECGELTSITLPNTVKTIQNSAFHNCKKLSTVDLGSGLETIGSDVFSGCAALKSITIPSTVTSIGSVVFQESGIESLTLTSPSTLEIAPVAFQNCADLKTVTIAAAKKIGSAAFAGCDSLETMTFGNGVLQLDAAVAYELPKLNSVTFGTGLKKIEGSAFTDCTALESVTFSETGGNVAIGTGAFAGCVKLSDLTLVHNMTISENAFDGCAALTEVEIFSESRFSSYPFKNCTNLLTVKAQFPVWCAGALVADDFEHDRVEISLDTSFPGASGGVLSTYGMKLNTEVLEIKSGVKVINAAAFMNWGVKEVILADSVKTLATSAFSDCSSLESVDMGDGVEVIDSACFYGSTALTEVTMSASLKSIGPACFYNCSALTSITLPASLKSIGSDAFAFSGLEEIVIPGTITGIPASGGVSEKPAFYGGAFENCKQLKKVTIEEGIKDLKNGMFNACSALETIVLPDGVELFDASALSGCTALKQVIFMGGAPTDAKSYVYDSLPAGLVTYYLSENEAEWAGAGITGDRPNRVWRNRPIIALSKLTVTNGTYTSDPISPLEGYVLESATVTLMAANMTGRRFAEWNNVSSVGLADKESKSTTFVMPSSDVTVAARFDDIPNPKTGVVSVFTAVIIALASFVALTMTAGAYRKRKKLTSR